MKRPACYAPWSHLNVDAGGEMRPCCICRLKIKAKTLEEGWNSPEMKAFRVRMLNGEMPPEYCDHCIDPRRTWIYAKSFDYDVAKGDAAEQVLLKTKPDGETSFVPVSIDLRTHLCNLKCRTCSGFASSAMRSERKKHDIPIQIYRETELSDLHLSDLTVANQTFVESAKKFYWAGGEPFMSPLHWEVLDHLIKTNNTKAFMFYSTNATFPGKTLDRAIEALSHFPKVELAFSLDGDGEYSDYVRAGSDINEIWENIRALKERLPHAKFSVDTTITNCGILSLEGLIQKCVDHDLLWTGHLLNKWDYNCYLGEKMLRKEVFDSHLDEALKIATHPESIKSLNFIKSSYSHLPVTEADYVESERYEKIRGMEGFFKSKIVPFT